MSDDLRSREFVGQGLHYPLAVDSRGRLALTNPVNEVEQSIYVILETAPGERVMRPEFGCRIWELIFDPRDLEMEARVITYVEEALNRWEPRITIKEIEILPSQPHNQHLLQVRIVYEVKNTHDERSIIYPFYIMNEE